MTIIERELKRQSEMKEQEERIYNEYKDRIAAADSEEEIEEIIEEAEDNTSYCFLSVGKFGLLCDFACDRIEELK